MEFVWMEFAVSPTSKSKKRFSPVYDCVCIQIGIVYQYIPIVSFTSNPSTSSKNFHFHPEKIGMCNIGNITAIPFYEFWRWFGFHTT